MTITQIQQQQDRQWRKEKAAELKSFRRACVTVKGYPFKGTSPAPLGTDAEPRTGKAL